VWRESARKSQKVGKPLKTRLPLSRAIQNTLEKASSFHKVKGKLCATEQRSLLTERNGIAGAFKFKRRRV
jgi:hypothetical protein